MPQPNSTARADAEGTMLVGTVVTFDSSKGYGFIRPDNGMRDVFFHRSKIDDPGQMISVWDRVSFEPQVHVKGFRALHVRVVPQRTTAPLLQQARERRQQYVQGY